MLPGGHCLTLNDTGLMLHSKCLCLIQGYVDMEMAFFFLIAVDYYVTVDISCTCNFKNPKRQKVINQ